VNNKTTKGEKIMKLPKQSAPVQRNITGTAIVSQSGVEASAVPWKDILNGVGSLASLAGLGTGIASLIPRN
jgi:hypothetical protein